MTKISTIIPVYNRPETLIETVQSILAQHRVPDEIIVVDDGSQDDIASAMAPFQDKIILHRQENGGAGAARNTGAQIASGDWLTFLDSDDVWTPERMTYLMRDLATAGPNDVAHYGDTLMTGGTYSASLLKLHGHSFALDHATRLTDPLPVAIPGMSLGASAVRRDLWLDLGGLPAEMPMYEDVAFFCRLALRGHFLVTGAQMQVARRVEGDVEALTSLERNNPVKAQMYRAQHLEELLQEDMTTAQRDRVIKTLSGAEFLLGGALLAKDAQQARQYFLKSARRHPHPTKGWVKSALPLLFGRRGFAWATRHRTPEIDRS